MAELHLVSGMATDRVVAITSLPCVLGRASTCDHRLDDPMISRRHCRFSLRGDRVWVEDLGSLHGTQLNGEPLAEPRPVADGDSLQLARLTFVARLRGPPEETRGLDRDKGQSRGRRVSSKESGRDSVLLSAVRQDAQGRGGEARQAGDLSPL